MKKIGFVFLALVLCYSGFAQKSGVFKFENNGHDFGTFKEEAGPQKHRFVFKNAGGAPIIVKNVQAGCGCTTPGWAKEEIAAGKNGWVDAEYNPAGRPGKFDKYLTVTGTAGGRDTIITLSIKGNVIEKEKGPADLYPDKIANFRMVSRNMYLGRVSPGTKASMTFKIYNEGDKAETLQPFDSKAYPHIKISYEPATLKPKETGNIKVDFDGSNKKDYGYSSDQISLNTASGQKLDLYVVATLEDEPKKLTPEEAEKEPKLAFDKKEHDFGKLKAGVEVQHDFTFTNRGKKDLTIHKTKANCGCTASEPSKKVLKPGESSSIKVKFNTTGKPEGPQTQMVTIYSSDPVEPTQYISIKAVIDKNAPETVDLLSNPKKPMVSTGAGAQKQAK